jgi:hypothetical protein
MPQSISIIGMSNAGKSYWRERASAAGFTPFCCDDRIERNLKLILRSREFGGIEEVAKWMGQPYEPQYAANSAVYLEQEILVMEEAIGELRGGGKPLFIDTTGSVIYTGENILSQLRGLSTVVMIETPESLREELYRKYLAERKPVIWAEAYAPLGGESPEETLTRCYPVLLRSRDKMYRREARVILDYCELRAPGFTFDDFLKKSADLSEGKLPGIGAGGNKQQKISEALTEPGPPPTPFFISSSVHPRTIRRPR